MAKKGDWWLSREMGGLVGKEWVAKLAAPAFIRQLSGFESNTIQRTIPAKKYTKN